MSYIGNKIKIPLGELGLLTDIAPDKMPPHALIRANNIVLTQGTVQKAPGSYRWNSSALDSGVVAVHDWIPSSGVKRMIAVTSGGSIYKGRDRAFGTAINTGLGTLNPNCMFVEGGAEVAGNPKKLFLFTGGVTTPKVLSGDGSAFASISSPSTDWTISNYPKCGAVHRNRLWAFAGQISYASDTANHENFATNALADPVYPGEGGEILGCFVYKGRLFAFKDGGFVYLLNDLDASDSNWYWEKLASNFGLCAPNAIDEVLDNLYAGNSTGTVTDYAATEKLGSVEAGDLVSQLAFETFLRANTSKVGIEEQHILYYAEKKLLFVTYRSHYRTTNDMLIVFDFSRPQVTRPTFWIKGTPQCLATFRDANNIERPMYGDASGYVLIMDHEDRIEGASAYTGEFQIPHLDFSHVDQALSATEKHFDFLAVHYLPESSGTLSCDYYIDGRFVETLTFQMVQNTNAQLGNLLLSTDRLAQGNAETCIRKLAGSGRTFSARFYNSGSNQSFQIPAVTVYFRGGGDKATQQE